MILSLFISKCNTFSLFNTSNDSSKNKCLFIICFKYFVELSFDLIIFCKKVSSVSFPTYRTLLVIIASFVLSSLSHLFNISRWILPDVNGQDPVIGANLSVYRASFSPIAISFSVVLLLGCIFDKKPLLTSS